VFFLVFHHIIADFWSMGVFIDEFVKSYAVERSGRAVIPAGVSYQTSRAGSAMIAGEEGDRHWATGDGSSAGRSPFSTSRPTLRPPVRKHRGPVRPRA
jgi:hypothetical protein